VVALVEQQVQRAPHRLETDSEISAGQIEQPLGLGQRLLAARDALLDRGTARQERSSDLGRSEAAQHVQDQGELRFFGQARLAAGKHHAQLLVAHDSGRKRLVQQGRQLLLGVERAAQLRRERSRRALAPQAIQRAVLRRRHQPPGRVVGYALRLPRFQGAAQGVLHHVFRELQLVQSEQARERRDHARRLASEQVLFEVVRHGARST
jgi:hypothetical protein